jgi:hypothetical protein
MPRNGIARSTSHAACVDAPLKHVVGHLMGARKKRLFSGIIAELLRGRV